MVGISVPLMSPLHQWQAVRKQASISPVALPFQQRYAGCDIEIGTGAAFRYSFAV